MCNSDWRLYLKRQSNWLITASYKRLEQRLVKCNEEQGWCREVTDIHIHSSVSSENLALL